MKALLSASLFVVAVGCATVAKDTAPQSITLVRTVHFGAVTAAPGTYAVLDQGDGTIRLAPAHGASLALPTVVTTHGRTVSAASAIEQQLAPDVHQVALLFPWGVAFEARGSYSGARLRGETIDSTSSLYSSTALNPLTTTTPGTKDVTDSSGSSKPEDEGTGSGTTPTLTDAATPSKATDQVTASETAKSTDTTGIDDSETGSKDPDAVAESESRILPPGNFLMVAAVEFVPISEFAPPLRKVRSVANGRDRSAETGPEAYPTILAARVRLPQGAQIESVKFIWDDTDPYFDATCQLLACPVDTRLPQLGLAQTRSVGNGGAGAVIANLTTCPPVDNRNNSYVLRLRLPAAYPDRGYRVRAIAVEIAYR